VTSAAAQTAA